MKTSIRFENAITKLYNAFQNDTLNPEDCRQCAIGTILDNNDSWKHMTDIHGTIKLCWSCSSEFRSKIQWLYTIRVT